MKNLIVLLIISSSHVKAWGPTGHRVVGEVAEKFMSPDVLLRAKKLLDGQSLSRVANWADEIKSDPTNYSHTYRWHYTDWPDGKNNHSEENSSGILIGSINEQLTILKNFKLSDEKRSSALKFLVHLVGDIHQPMHVGNGLDMGGNTCKVTFHGKVTNLHQLWDEGMIEFTQLSYTELGSYVAQGRSEKDIREWKKGALIDWARESKIIRNEIYPANVVSNSIPAPTKHYCRKDVLISQEEMPKLAYEYSYRFMPVVEKRLFQGGLRLAELLNRILK